MTTSVEGVVLVVPALALGAAAALSSATYRPLRHLVTVVHEAGHAVIALLTGRRLNAIRLHRDSSGETVSAGRAKGLGVVLTLLAGYPAPSAVGLAGVWAVGHADARMWILLLGVVLCGLLLMLRNLFGFVVLSVCLATLFGLTRAAAAAYATPAVMGISSFLLVAALRGCWELWRAPARGDDASALARSTGVAAILWRLLFLLLALGAVAGGGWLAFTQTAVSHAVSDT